MSITLSLPERFKRAYPPMEPPDAEALWIVLRGEDVVVVEDGGDLRLPMAARDADLPIPALSLAPHQFLGELDGHACIAAAVDPDTPLPRGLGTSDVRSLHEHLDPDVFSVLGYAYQIVRWQAASRFCAFCGGPSEAVAGEWGKRCAACNHVAYPHVSPCVIALIHDGGDRILLAHRRGRGPMRSLVAGFVEPGESLEAALAREAREEVGVELEDIRYFASQPWPFPHQLMLGFFARYAGGEVRPDGDEIDEVGWFAIDELPVIPGPISIARRLIDAHLVARRAHRAGGGDR